MVENEERPAKRVKLLSDDDDPEDDSMSNASGGISLSRQSLEADDTGFKINEEYARRFEHNQKRAELHQCMPFTEHSQVSYILISKKWKKNMAKTLDHLTGTN